MEGESSFVMLDAPGREKKTQEQTDEEDTVSDTNRTMAHPPQTQPTSQNNAES